MGVSSVVVEKGLAGSGGENGGEGNSYFLSSVGQDMSDPCLGCTKVQGRRKGSKHGEGQELIRSGRSIVLRDLLKGSEEMGEPVLIGSKGLARRCGPGSQAACKLRAESRGGTTNGNSMEGILEGFGVWDDKVGDSRQGDIA